jgi:hypothetical protein
MREIRSNKSKSVIQISKHSVLCYIWERKWDYRLAFKNILILGVYEHVFTGWTIGVLFHTQETAHLPYCQMGTNREADHPLYLM